MKFIRKGSEINVKKRYPALYFRKAFSVEKGVKKAVIKMTALGVYEPYLNGGLITENRLMPGFTNYHRRLQYQEFDVTRLMQEGENCIGAVVGDGWYRGNIGAFNSRYSYGKELKFAAILEAEYEDGTVFTLETDESWECCEDGPLRENDLKTLERYEAVREEEWCSVPLMRKSKWHWENCRLAGDYEGELIRQTVESVMEKETFIPKVITTLNGETILDFGQNLAGHVWFQVTGSEGDEVALTMGETLDTQGNFTLENLQGKQKPGSALYVGQRLEYVLKEGTQEYKSAFLISGYRYVKPENWPEEIRPENFKSIAMYSDMEQTGNFSCSNEKVNRLVENIRWSQKSNFVDIPTDCPQRERAGWAGDINVYLETADFFMDTRKFMAKWMEDFRQAQMENGALPYIIPEVPSFGSSDSSAGWSDAISTIPLKQYEFYGDISEIERTYEAARSFVEFNRKRAVKNHILHFFKKEEHYSRILDTGYHYGEWLEPGSSNIKGGIKAMLYPDAEAATAWFYYGTENVAKMAGILGKEKDKEKYSELARQIRSAYRKEFLKNGRVESKRQCRYVRPVYMGLLEKEEAEQAVKDLNQMCVGNGYRIGTGFLTTYQILKVLTDYGYADTAYRMLLNENCPGWLYEVNMGATTVWEGWDAISEHRNKVAPLSQNHYSPGAAMSWLFTHCAGIRPKAPGFKEVFIRPYPNPLLKWAEASYESIRGKITSAWEYREDEFILRVEIPKGVKATVQMPNQRVYENAVSGEYRCTVGEIG